ncbi:hypothetical protein OC844_001448 [Tilletia horrida]|nr:hypothetical protein OC844_001448 [Tilletia horrida]
METSYEYRLASKIVATAGKAIVAIAGGSSDPSPPLADANATAAATPPALPGVPRSVPELLSMARAPTPQLATLLFVAIALVLTIFTLILAAFDAIRGIAAIRRRAARMAQDVLHGAGACGSRSGRQGHELHLLEEEDAPRLLGAGWRPFYALCVMAASICQVTHLLVYMQAHRGLSPRQLQLSTENAAFASSILAAFFLLLAAVPSSPASRLRLGSTVSNARSTAWHYLVVALVSLGPVFAILLMVMSSTRYLRASQPLDSALRLLLDNPAACATQQVDPATSQNGTDGSSTLSLCSVYSIAFFLQGEAGAAKFTIALKATVLLCLAVLITIVANDALRALRYRQAALTDVHMQLEQARLENEDLGLGVNSDAGSSVSEKSEYTGRSGARSVADSRRGSLFRSGMSAEAERDYLRYLEGLGFHCLSRRDSMWSRWSGDSFASGDHGKPIRRPPPSYSDLDSNGRSPSFSEILNKEATRGVDLDTSDAMGRALQRQYGCVEVKRVATSQSKSSSTSSQRSKSRAASARDNNDADGSDDSVPRLPGYLNAHIAKPEAAAIASRDDENDADDDDEDSTDSDRGLARMKSSTRLGRVESLARARSLRLDEIDASKIVPAATAVHPRSGRQRPRGARPLGGGASGDSYTGGPRSRTSSTSRKSSYAYSRWSHSERSGYSPSRAPSPDAYSQSSMRWHGNGNGNGSSSSRSSGTSALAMYSQPHPHPGSIALTLSAAAASSSAALARTAPLRSRMRLNRALALSALGLFLLLLMVMLALGDQLEFGDRPRIALVLAAGTWVVESGLHAAVLGLLIFRGSGAVEEIPLEWPRNVPDLENGRSAAETKDNRI